MVQSDFFEASEEALTDEIALEDIFQAYYDCRKNKRRTINALAVVIGLKNIFQSYFGGK